MSGNDAVRRGLRLRAERKRRRLSQVQVASMIQTSDKTIRDMERGKFQNPTTLPALLNAYDMTEDDLHTGDEPKDNTPSELAALEQFPRGVFIALLVWGSILSRMDETEQNDKIDAVTKLLLATTK